MVLLIAVILVWLTPIPMPPIGYLFYGLFLMAVTHLLVGRYVIAETNSILGSIERRKCFIMYIGPKDSQDKP